MFSLDKPEELIKIRLISSIWNNQFDSPEKIESLFQLSRYYRLRSKSANCIISRYHSARNSGKS
ncbi:MAG: hypothetical protein HEQ31_09345 [Dolichospermum sp. OL03]|nr:hypothetical protein [Dolichospermum sp. OL01]MCO5796977.1 hypothetical protein [Dolichospermum sp. OL03]MCS6282525.1 hypothetical protein [Dolichospermum sp.]